MKRRCKNGKREDGLRICMITGKPCKDTENCPMNNGYENPVVKAYRDWIEREYANA